MGQGHRFHSSLTGQTRDNQSCRLLVYLESNMNKELSGIKTWAIFREDNCNLSSLSSSWVELTSVSLTEKCITMKVFSNPASSTGICLSEFFYFLSNYAEKTSLVYGLNQASLQGKIYWSNPKKSRKSFAGWQSYQRLCVWLLFYHF